MSFKGVVGGSKTSYFIQALLYFMFKFYLLYTE